MGSHSSVGSLLYVFAFVNIHFVVMETFFFPRSRLPCYRRTFTSYLRCFWSGQSERGHSFQMICLFQWMLFACISVRTFLPSTCNRMRWQPSSGKKSGTFVKYKKEKERGKKSDLPLKKHHLISETLEAACQASDVLYSGVISGFRWTEEPRCIWPLSVQDSIKAKSDLFCFSFSFAPLLFLLISLQFTVLYWHEW